MYKFNRNSQITFSDFNQSLGMKMNENNRWVKKANIPIPFSDAIALVPTQVAMISGITAAYKIKLEKGIMASIFSCLVGITGVTIGGRALSAELLKLIPGVGNAINGTTAAVLTIALGETYIFIIEAIAMGEIMQENIGSDEFKAKIKKVFETNLKAIGKSPIEWIKKNK